MGYPVHGPARPPEKPGGAVKAASFPNRKQAVNSFHSRGEKSAKAEDQAWEIRLHVRRGWKGRRGKENTSCKAALPQPQQGLGGTRRRRRFASSSSVAGGRGREHARLPAIRISSCKPGTSTCAERGSSGQRSKPSAHRCFEWSTAGFSNGRC